jgi:dipeptidyl aminopeptidase/acylaminoacyl peptidase
MSWSSDGRFVLFEQDDHKTHEDIWILDLDSDETRPFLETPFGEYDPRFSPDDRWIAYTSEESGRPEVYARRFPGPGGKVQISIEGGEFPVWSPDGRELIYRAGDTIMAVDIRAEDELAVSRPGLLFTSEVAGDTIAFDLAPDGQTFVMQVGVGTDVDRPQPHVVLNWFAELARLVPTDGP